MSRPPEARRRLLQCQVIPSGLSVHVHIKVVVTGDDYQVFLGNAVTPVTTLTHTAFASGLAGLYDFGCGQGGCPQSFDNFSLSDPNPAQVPLPAGAVLLLGGLGALAGLGRLR